MEFYVPFSRAFSAELKRIAVQYPGRPDRHDVSTITSIPALADDIYKMLAPAAGSGARIAFFGHSMGALMAFEVARRFESAGNPIAALFVSASAAPGRMNYDYFHQRSDDELLKMVTDLTGTAPGFLDEKFVAAILPTLRSYRAIVDYTCSADVKVSCPIYAYAGSDDGVVDYQSVPAWSERTTSEFSVRVFPGDHFYVTQNGRELADEVQSRLSSNER